MTACVGRQPDDPRPWIADLGLRRDGADFDEAKAQSQQRVRHLAVLVEARRHADRVREIQPECPDRQPRVVGHEFDEWRDFQGENGQPVRVFRIEQTQQRPGPGFKQPDHGIVSGNTCRPSRPSGSGSVQTTASSGSAP